jgi:hypothetical protein
MKSPKNLILLLLSIGLFYTFTSPQYKEVKALQASVGEYRNVIENVSRIAEARDALLLDYETIPLNQLEHLEKILPDNVDTVRLALDLDTIASRYAISIKDVQVDNKVDTNAALIFLPEHALPYEKVTVSFSFISNYQNFMRMLGDLEKSLRIMDVKTVSFKISESGLYEHRMTVETYWLK